MVGACASKLERADLGLTRSYFVDQVLINNV